MDMQDEIRPEEAAFRESLEMPDPAGMLNVYKSRKDIKEAYREAFRLDRILKDCAPPPKKPTSSMPFYLQDGDDVLKDVPSVNKGGLTQGQHDHWQEVMLEWNRYLDRSELDLIRDNVRDNICQHVIAFNRKYKNGDQVEKKIKNTYDRILKRVQGKKIKYFQ